MEVKITTVFLLDDKEIQVLTIRMAMEERGDKNAGTIQQAIDLGRLNWAWAMDNMRENSGGGKMKVIIRDEKWEELLSRKGKRAGRPKGRRMKRSDKPGTDKELVDKLAKE